jgi:hypothetical protein
MKSLFKKRQNIFLKLLHDQAQATLAGLEALLSYMKSPNSECSTKLDRKSTRLNSSHTT